MATDSNILKVSEMDFDTIKANLKTYMSSQTTFQDHNFEGSALSSMLDVLSYVTHYNAINANIAINEAFLDSARLRPSVVSHAKLLGYTPRSSYAAVAYVNVQVNSPVGMQNDDGSFKQMTMLKGTVFTANIDGTSYKFATGQTLTTTRNSDGLYIFLNVKLLQGSYKSSEYIFDKDSAEKYLIPHETAVTSELTVQVEASATNDFTTTFEPVTEMTDITSTSAAYWLEESRTGVFEVKFGDGILGKSLTNGNIIKLEYLVTDTDEANGASVFNLSGTIQGNSNVTISVISKASGGSAKEDIDSIKFNAPLAYVSQNRAVTPDDYKTIVQNNFANIDAISVWGGEDNDPPDYGKVYISIKPKDAEFVSAADKELIKGTYLKPKNVVSITPELVDPTYTFIFLEVFFKYNPNVTDLSEDALEEAIRTSITTYNTNELKRFDGVFRYSALTKAIDATNTATLNSITRVKMKKRIFPTLNTETKYILTYASPFFATISSSDILISSTEFTYKGNGGCSLRDRLNTTTGVRTLQVVTNVGTPQEIIIDSDAGTINVAAGSIEATLNITQLPSGETYVEVTAAPNSYDIAPKRNELLDILTSDSVISGEVDTMITGGTSAGVDYTTTSRIGTT